MPMWLQAAGWGFVGGAALVIGAALACAVRLPQRLVAAVMAAGAGVLIAAVAFELVEEADRAAGLGATAAGLVLGAAVYTAANVALARRGAKHRKRSGHHADARQPSADAATGEDTGLAIAVGALVDGIPESVVIGVSLLGGGGVSVATVAAVFLSNVPEGLSSAAGMRRAGRSLRYVFGVWGGIAVASALAALVGNVALAGADPAAIAVTNALAAGGILAMIVDTMIPEAFDTTHDYAGLITAGGFLAAFALDRLGG